MDVAFGVIGVGGVAAQLFDSILSVYQLLSTANELSRDAPIALWKLKIQETRFIIWGRYWGVETGKLDKFLQDNVQDVPIIIIITDHERGQTQITAPASDSKEKISSIAKTDPPTKAKWGTKLRWAITDKSKFEDLIKDLKDFNDGLYSILRLNESISLERIIQSNVLRGAPSASETIYIQDACSSETRDISKEPSTRSAILYKDIYTSAQAKLARLHSTNNETATPSQRRPRAAVEIPIERTRSENRCLARYTDQHRTTNWLIEHNTIATSTTDVIIEWKDIIDPNSPTKTLIEKRLDSLAFLFSAQTQKPADFNILECLGYFEDIEFPRYGMIFRAPYAETAAAAEAKKTPESLYDILGNNYTAIEDSALPNLGDKFELAKSLVVSILRLHDCGWIHGAFRSSNIIFFPSSSSNNEQEDCSPQNGLKHPYITGFTYSRPTDPSSSTLEYSQTHFSHDLYRHPDVAQFASRKILRSGNERERFQMKHDLYSLGIVLLEIGLWRRVEMLWKERYESDHKRFWRKLVEAYVPRLGPKMGAVYRDVVGGLLGLEVAKGEVGEEMEETGRRNDVEAASLGDRGAGPKIPRTGLSSEVYWDVVQKLEKCHA
ncbi:hypothetical protein G7Y89_g5657 [Cudoniella acicularis]|uniref:Prion-inhibition and propagation HeLo domain-containing protein n=1 Tax=Cudoniella acicularis TaxID=354080 RepID=A0A8H4RMV8_9HELO|nr:hypothetical protein G7Y89_g5657 [Cudoniella acicularis]